MWRRAPSLPRQPDRIPPRQSAMSEDSPLDPGTIRGASKAAGAILWRQYARAYEMTAAELRLFSIYGPGENDTRFVPTLLRAAMEQNAVPLLRGPRHDWTFVGDVADACVRALEAPRLLARCSTCTGREHSNEEVAALAERVTG